MNHAGRPEYLTVVIESSGTAYVTGELFDFDDPDQHVRKIKGTGPGMVTYRNERTLRVAPRSEEELRRAGLIEG